MTTENNKTHHVIDRVILIVLDGVGCGALPDAEQYGDPGADSLGHVSRSVSSLSMPNLRNWGLGNLTSMPNVAPLSADQCRASFGRCRELSLGKDTTSGHWEMAGVVVEKAFATFPSGFPKDALEKWVKENNLPGYLGNMAASGTEIIKNLGEEHMKSGKPIVYTSADSVWQIAAHEETFGLERLLEISKSARKLCDELQISRVIARPFIGAASNSFQRTHHRKDFSQSPSKKTMMEYLLDQNIPTLGIGKIWNIYNGKGISRSIETHDNADGLKTLLQVLDSEKKGLLFLNLIDFDMNYGHRRDPVGYARALEEFDRFIPTLEQKLTSSDLVIVTSDHGNDPTYKGTDHTREHVPLLAFRPGHRAQSLGDRSSFSDIGQTILEALTSKRNRLPHGESFWPQLCEPSSR